MYELTLQPTVLQKILNKLPDSKITGLQEVRWDQQVPCYVAKAVSIVEVIASLPVLPFGDDELFLKHKSNTRSRCMGVKPQIMILEIIIAIISS